CQVIIYVAHNVLALFFKANSVTELVDLYNCEVRSNPQLAESLRAVVGVVTNNLLWSTKQ
ncbi:hypothetical protein, partial [Mucilaginibacter sp. SG564]|uniref:hypothetical protein n=1 Tax=Mucilaginibacter sp. SG564 TaxID=2587022 RepID=UPI001C12A7BA